MKRNKLYLFFKFTQRILRLTALNYQAEDQVGWESRTLPREIRV